MTRRPFLFIALLVVFSLLGVTSVFAQVVQPPCPMPFPCPLDALCEPMPCPPLQTGVFTNPEWLKIRSHRVNVTIDDQVARTQLSMEFVNEGNGLAEGTFIFPLPMGASVDELIMYINDEPIQARIMDADEARAYYDAIVRQSRDPALLEYLGTTAVQANVFPIPPGDKRRIEITYSQALTADNNLLHYIYPLDVSRLTSDRPIETMSVHVELRSSQPIGTVYSPSHNIAISRAAGDLNAVSVGFEASDYRADQDFSLFWGVDAEAIDVNLLTYRDSAVEDGFFLLLVQPPLTVDPNTVAPKDLILVVDQSGSMDGDKWTQAQDAARYVLENLNAEDRFNAILFSTGTRVFSSGLEGPGTASEAAAWIDGQFPEGGTNINDALLQAFGQTSPERQTTILFITDGIPTEGEEDSDQILANLEAAAPVNARVFTFGVGDDVDTFLLDKIATNFGGASSYVRPSERIDEEVASLYTKISAPVLTNLELTVDGTMIDSTYPTLPLPDLFAGSQLAVAGRYRSGVENATITLSGDMNGERRTFVYDGLSFREVAGGEPFVAQLWATRRIGDLLNTIRLQGENSELVDSIINLSVRFGIITPYTSFLIDENDILSQTGRAAAAEQLSRDTQTLSLQGSGAAAVGAADMAANMQEAAAPMPMATMTAGEPGAGESVESGQQPLQTVGGKTFFLRDGVWTDSTFDADSMTTEQTPFLSDAYFALLAVHPELGEFFALGERVIVVLDGTAYEVTAAE
ncbi:MAG TPA: VIT domain-containing protein [Candidatus Limnocylindrales bacterium]|nr:VIT domain-containing protein [Candidatus Limnocylindrales bacterium]